MVAGLLDKLPTMSSDAFREELVTESCDATLVNLLCLVTKGVDECQQLVQCSSEAFSRR
jgi:hypothetical protein